MSGLREAQLDRALAREYDDAERRRFALVALRDERLGFCGCRAESARRHVDRHGAGLMEWQVALVLPQKVEEALVVVGREIEQLDEPLVAPAGFFEPARDYRTQVG